MSKYILLQSTVFLIRDISMSMKDRLCLSFKTLWVDLVRASICAVTFFRPGMGRQSWSLMIISVENKMYPSDLGESDIGSCQCGVNSSCVQGKPRVQQPNHPGGSYGQRFVAHNCWVSFRAT